MPTVWPLHPALLQSALELRARARRWRHRPGESLFHALALIALAALSGVFLASLAPRMQPVVDLWRAQPMASMGVFVLFALWKMHQRASAFESACVVVGWLSALPIAPGQHRRGLGQHLLLGAVVALLWAIAFAVVASLSGALTAKDSLALVLQWLAALLLGVSVVFALRGRSRGATGAGILSGAEPTMNLRSEVRGWSVAPRWLGPWPELGQLQRRRSQRAWRSGHAWVWLLPLGLLVLAGEGARVFAGMLLLVVMLPWLRTTLDASARALAESERLLLATPRSRIDFCRSGWRYPASRALLASVMFALALALFGASPLVVALGAFGFLLLCGLEIALMLHYPRSRARQRGQLTAEIALLLVLAREGLGPAVLLPAIGMIGWHAWRARRLA